MLLARIYSLPKILSLSLPGVFFLGTVITLLVRYILYLYHPDVFQHTTPSISRTAAFEPGSIVFTVGINITVILILISWHFVFHFNASRLRRIDKSSQGVQFLNLLAYSFGIISAIFLALLALINSAMDGPLHEIFSIVYFATQVAAFTFDFILWHVLVRKNGIHPDEYRHGQRKALLFIVIACVSALMLFLYLLKIYDVYHDGHQLITSAFVFFEYTTSILCFLYAFAYYPEIKRYLYSQ